MFRDNLTYTLSHSSTERTYLNATSQIMLPEAIAIVMAPKDTSRYIMSSSVPYWKTVYLLKNIVFVFMSSWSDINLL